MDVETLIRTIEDTKMRHEHTLRFAEVPVAVWSMAYSARTRRFVNLMSNTGGLIGQKGAFSHVKPSTLPVEFAILFAVYQTGQEVTLDEDRLVEFGFNEFEDVHADYATCIRLWFLTRGVDRLPDVIAYRKRLDEWLTAIWLFASEGPAATYADATPDAMLRHRCQLVKVAWDEHRAEYAEVVESRKAAFESRRYPPRRLGEKRQALRAPTAGPSGAGGPAHPAGPGSVLRGLEQGIEGPSGISAPGCLQGRAG